MRLCRRLPAPSRFARRGWGPAQTSRSAAASIDYAELLSASSDLLSPANYLLRSAIPPRDPEASVRELTPSAVALAVEALGVARARPLDAVPALRRWRLERSSRLGRDRHLVPDAVHAVLRHDSLLALCGARRDEERLELWDRSIRRGLCPEAPPGSAVPSTPAGQLAVALSVPQRVAAEWLAVLGSSGAASLARVLGSPRQQRVTVRPNPARAPSRGALAERLLREGVRCEPCGDTAGLRLLSGVDVRTLGSFREGWFEVQDEASQRMVDAIPAAPAPRRILDLCAGAGGKALALLARWPDAEVVAVDCRGAALSELRRRAQRQGCAERLEVVHADAEEAARSLRRPGGFCVVVVDAPCSGTGRLARCPALRLGLRRGVPFATLVAQQEALLGLGGTLVRPAGHLVYATCSLLAAENSHPLPGGAVAVQELTLWPHVHGCDGFHFKVARVP